MKTQTIEFESRIVRETSFSSEDLGMHHNKMQLIPTDYGYCIELIIDDEEVVEIGIWTKGNKVTDYDGVFELPKEAIKLLKKNKLNTFEVEN